jgi:hypothetical protein
MHMPFENEKFDAVYEIDATCHAPDQVRGPRPARPGKPVTRMPRDSRPWPGCLVANRGERTRDWKAPRAETAPRQLAESQNERLYTDRSRPFSSSPIFQRLDPPLPTPTSSHPTFQSYISRRHLTSPHRLPPQIGCYKEIYRVLKPGSCFAGYEWCATDQYDPTNEEHKKVGGGRVL